MRYNRECAGYSTFKVGDRVRVIKQRKYPSEKLLNLVGTVRSTCYGPQIAVSLDDCKNARSSCGYYYFKESDLEYENMEEKNMEKFTDYLNCAHVELVSNNTSYSYYCANFDPDLNVGDYCAVKCGNKLNLAIVIEIVDKHEGNFAGEVVAKVYTDAYDSRVKVRERAVELKAKMEERAKQLQDVALYKMLAENDPGMADLLREYQDLTKV